MPKADGPDPSKPQKTWLTRFRELNNDPAESGRMAWHDILQAVSSNVLIDGKPLIPYAEVVRVARSSTKQKLLDWEIKRGFDLTGAVLVPDNPNNPEVPRFATGALENTVMANYPPPPPQPAAPAQQQQQQPAAHYPPAPAVHYPPPPGASQPQPQPPAQQPPPPQAPPTEPPAGKRRRAGNGVAPPPAPGFPPPSPQVQTFPQPAAPQPQMFSHPPQTGPAPGFPPPPPTQAAPQFPPPAAAVQTVDLKPVLDKIDALGIAVNSIGEHLELLMVAMQHLYISGPGAPLFGEWLAKRQKAWHGTPQDFAEFLSGYIPRPK